MKKTLIFIVLLNFLLAESQNQESPIAQSVEVLRNNMPLITLIILFTFVFSAFAYFFGKILNMGSVKAWAKDQIYEAFLSLFIGLVGIFILENFFLNQNFGNLLSSAQLLPDVCSGKNDLFKICECELESFLNDLSSFLWIIFSVDSLVNALSMLSVKIGIAIPPGVEFATLQIVWQPLSEVGKDISDALATAYQTLLVAFVLVSFQIYLLKVVPYLFLFFFPAGVLLRSFGLTRKVGGSLIALSVGLALLYPILVAIGYGYTLKTYPFELEILQFFSKIDLWFKTIGGVIGGLYSGIEKLTQSTGLLNALLKVFEIFFGAQLVIEFFNLLVLILYLFFDVNLLAPLVLGILVVPVLIFYVLDNFIKGFSRLAGAEVGVLGLLGQLL
jgi:hypothetical protein